MSDGQTNPTPTPGSTAAAPPPAGVSRTALIWIGVAVVVLSFVAAFLGSWLARSAESDEEEAAPTPTASESATVSPDYEEIISEILPAGSAVRAGTGAPESGKGYEGDVYIDRKTADVYVFQDDWVWVGNIRTNAAENLTGESGPAGTPGAPGEAGAPGTAGTQVLLGEVPPDNKTCETDGDIYIDTVLGQFWECTGGEWTPSGPPHAQGQVVQPLPT